MWWESAAMWAATVLYVIQSGVYMYLGNVPQGFVLVGYTIANIALIWSTMK